MTELGNPDHAGWFRDTRRVIDVVEVTPGLPLPSIGSALAAFNYTNITHAEDAREQVILAETILSYALKVEFAPRDVPQVGSSAHYVRSAWMPSGLRVDIVARAGIFDGVDAQAQPELAVA